METRECDWFELEVQSDNSIEARWTTYDNTARMIKSKIADDLFLREDIDRRVAQLRKGQLDGQPEEIRCLGRDLYRVLFSGEIGTLFEQALQDVISDRQSGGHRWLRIMIDVDIQSDVLKWPLEFLCCEKQGVWLATERSLLTFSRCVRGGMLDLIPQSPPLRVLVVISRPEDLERIMTTKMLEEIGKLANTNDGEERRIEVKVLGQLEEYEQIPGIEYLNQMATYETVQRTNESWRPHIVHFIGHGRFEKTAGSLGLVDAANTVDWLSANDFFHVFMSWRPRLVFLQAIESAVSGTEPSFISLADYLVHHGIPAVVTMQFSMTDDNATLFAMGFYEALRDGKAIDQAVQDGRWKICCSRARWKEHSFATPVLFTYHPDAIIQTMPFPQKIEAKGG